VSPLREPPFAWGIGTPPEFLFGLLACPPTRSATRPWSFMLSKQPGLRSLFFSVSCFFFRRIRSRSPPVPQSSGPLVLGHLAAPRPLWLRQVLFLSDFHRKLRVVLWVSPSVPPRIPCSVHDFCSSPNSPAPVEVCRYKPALTGFSLVAGLTILLPFG